MSRRLIVLVVLAPALANAQDPLPSETPAETTPPASDPARGASDVEAPAIVADPPPGPDVDVGLPITGPARSPMGDQSISASLGAAIGGRTTAGGLRVAGSYLYKLAETVGGGSEDWFDGTAAFTFGGGSAECFRDRLDNVLCEHGLADGYAVELSANVQRVFHSADKLWPFARAGMGIGLVRFSKDDVTGVAIPIHIGAGLRGFVADGIAVIGQADLAFGIARFTSGVGLEPQLGVNVSAGVEFRL